MFATRLQSAAVLTMALCTLAALNATAETLSGQLTDPQGRPVAGAKVRLVMGRDIVARETVSDSDGKFIFAKVPSGSYQLSATAPGFAEVNRTVAVAEGAPPTLEIQFPTLLSRSETVTVTADVKNLDIEYPDPATKVYVRDEVLDANPGRPGAPISIPGYPIETASGGVKAPQYFAPGVAGDHGEPIATFFQVGSYLVPNNLSANAHGNGYSDPNAMVPRIIESVQVDGGAFNVREGNHSVNLAETYGFRERVEPYVTVTGDYRDIDVTAGWSPDNPAVKEFFAIEAAYGNGFLDRLEHRQQYKFNAFRSFHPGSHQVTLLGFGYYGSSYIPGLVPIGIPSSGRHHRQAATRSNAHRRDGLE